MADEFICEHDFQPRWEEDSFESWTCAICLAPRPVARSIGRVHPTATETKAECSKCPWTFETTVAGKAAHELMEHNTEEHSR